MDQDDALIGRVLSRREALVLLGGAGAAFLAACASGKSPGSTATATSGRTSSAASPTAGSQATAAATATRASASVPSCVVKPALTEGPYFVDEKINRSDIRSNTSDGAVKDGALFALTFNVSSVASDGTCTALDGVTVDVWHCDAAGVYSDASDPGFNTKGQNFLRGYQTTDAAGNAKFTTIYPGWYQGRAVHIHFKVRGTNAAGKSYDFTSQLFFADGFSEQVYAQAPYASKGTGFLRNANDNIYQESADQLTLDVKQSGNGYASTFDIGLQL